MKSDYKIESLNDKDDAKVIIDELIKFNLSKSPAILPELWISLNFVIKNSKSEIIAGVLSALGYWGGLEIRSLWVKEDQRKKGIGTLLLNKVEEEAVSKGAVISFLGTFDFQAEKFYMKHGYSIDGETKNFPQGHKMIYMSKRLNGHKI